MFFKLTTWIFLFSYLPGIWCKLEEIKIGGLFKDGDSEQHLAFMHAIELINQENLLFPYKLVGDGKLVNPDNEYYIAHTVCALFAEGVVGIFGPTSGSAADYVQSMCDNKEIPHIEIRPDVNHLRHALMVNLYPYPPTLSKVFVNIIKTWNWKIFTILYENFDDVPHISEVLKLDIREGYVITIRQLNVDHSGNYRPILTEAKRAGDTHFLVYCSLDNLYKLLTEAQQVGLLSDLHNYIIMEPDFHTIDLSPFQYGGSNITGVRIIDPENEDTIKIATELRDRLRTYIPPNDLYIDNRPPQYVFKSKTALMYDAVSLFASTLKDYLHSDDHRYHLYPKQLNCGEQDNWEIGNTIVNMMKDKNLEGGLSRNIFYDNQGFRSNFELDIVELTANGLIKVGVWNSTENVINITRPVIDDSVVDDESLHNKTFKVLISLTEPYGMLKESSVKLNGNDRFEGYGIDLIKDLSDMLGFNYTFIVGDSNYGGYNKQDKTWTGMIKQLMDFEGDLAITDFTITAERESGVDFTMPFMNLGISILFKKPMKLPPETFAFTTPFSGKVWICLGIAYFVVSIMLFIVGRISPAEWQNPFPCIEEPENLYNQFSIKNCFWFTLGSLMQQGSEIAPIGIATRMIAGVWWFFILIMVSSYTANLAACLAIESLSSPIRSIDDLPNQNKIGYGAKKNGATANFFRDSDNLVYKKIWEHMDTVQDDMTSDNTIGVDRANYENYAFFMESTSIEYTIERNCNLTQVGGLLDNKGYGIAMRKNSTYRNILSAAVVKLSETGRLAVLKNKWWKEKRGGGKCSADAGDSTSEELNFQNVLGVFLVLGVGSAGSVFMAFSEMVFGVGERARVNKVSFKNEFITELKFLFRCHGQTKPNTCNRSESTAGSSSKSLKSLDNQFSPTYGFINDIQPKKSLESGNSRSRSRRPSKLTNQRSS